MLKVTTLLSLTVLATSLAACDPDDHPAAQDAAPADAVAPPDGAPGTDASTPDATPGTDAPPQSTLTVDGTLSGDNTPKTGQIAVVWPVFTGSPDKQYFFGHGTQAGASFHLPLLADPPAEALNNGTGVGLVLLFSADAILPPDGYYEGDIPDGLIGASARHAIVYRAPGSATETLPWSSAFPVGYACGKCVDSATSFDTYEPVACDQLDVQAPTDLNTLDGCNFF